MSTQNKRSIEHYVPTTFPESLGLTNGENTMNVTVSYNEGGANYFSGGYTPRSYQVSVSAVKVADGCTSFVIGGNGFGRRYTLLPTTRFNAKVLAAINAAILPKLTGIVALALVADYAALAAIFTGVAAEVGAKPAQKRTTAAAACHDETAHLRASQA